jgi:CRISPR/Cas system-associated endonuclease/helicase Cas3
MYVEFARSCLSVSCSMRVFPGRHFFTSILTSILVLDETQVFQTTSTASKNLHF